MEVVAHNVLHNLKDLPAGTKTTNNKDTQPLRDAPEIQVVCVCVCVCVRGGGRSRVVQQLHVFWAVIASNLSGQTTHAAGKSMCGVSVCVCLCMCVCVMTSKMMILR